MERPVIKQIYSRIDGPLNQPFTFTPEVFWMSVYSTASSTRRRLISYFLKTPFLSKDIGFVEEGQIAEVKIDTFNFTKYGLLEGEITNLSNDAISDENLGLVHLTRVLLNETQIMVNDKLVKLSPGMSVTVEVKIGQRRIIEYFLSPLLRYKQESIREQ